MMRAAAVGETNDLTRVERQDPLTGTVLDQRFRMDRLLAAGGFGAVYRATDMHSDAAVAIKVLHAKLTREPMVVARFRRESKLLANLRDPHTITAYEFGRAPHGALYIVMELLHGESLYQRFRTSGPLPWHRVVHIARGVCSSLAEAHAAGIVHRDLKPANIHLETQGNDPDFVKVLDFGIAKIVGGNDRERTQLTQAGTMIGTVDYMSPEQMVGGELTGGSDIYALGVLMYEVITGRTPFTDAKTVTAILAAVLTRTPDPLSKYATVPPTLEQIVARCLERESHNRFADISDLADALASVVAPGVVRSTPAAPSNRFAQPGLSTAATLLDVRFTESSQTVLDARGPRDRLAGRFVLPPAVLLSPHLAPVSVGAVAPVAYPAATPVAHPPVSVAYSPTIPLASSSTDSRPGRRQGALAYAPTIPVTYSPTDSRPGQRQGDPAYFPTIPVASVAAPVAAPVARVSYPAAAYPAVPEAPAVFAVGSQRVIDVHGLQPKADGQGLPPAIDLAACQQQQHQQHQYHQYHQHHQHHGPPGVAPRVRAGTYDVRRYDMSAVARRDLMVRRIIWIALLVCAILALLIASR
jgi:serine/threonine-protein kinase